jgi:tetratricopeptide (TPR) repeat protein
MTRSTLGTTSIIVAASFAVIGLTSGVASAKPKKHKGAAAAPATPPASGGGGDMNFAPEEVHQDDAPATKKGGKSAPMTFAPDSVKPAGPPGPPSKVLERALKLYDAQDYPNSSIELNKVIEGQSGDDEGNRQRAEFFMGKTLFNMKYYSASLSYFDRIVQKGPAHRYYQKTLQWLAPLSRFLPESAGVLEKIGKYTKADLDQPALEPVRDELYYLLGRYHYAKGNFKEAIDLFSSVPEKSEFYPKAKFLEGLTNVREYHGKVAADDFKAILRKVKQYEDPDKVPKALKEAEELANLSLGRVFYSTKQYQQSIKYFEKLPGPDQKGGASPDWADSLFEASWAYFMLDGDSKALGNIHSIVSPFFETEFYPEAYILKAVIYFNRCNYDRSYEAINEFNAQYPDLRKEVDALLAKYADNAQFYDYILKIRSGEAGLSERAEHAAAGALNDRTLQKNIDWVNELDRELKAIDKADPAWKSTAVAGNILQDLTLQKSLAANDAGQLARNRLARLSSEIQDLTKQAIKIEYETLNAQKGQLTAGVQDASINPNSKNFNTIVIDDEHQQWPFKGEYWQDELGYYRFKVANKCGR